MSLFDPEDGSSLRTSPACSVPTMDEISPSFCVRWATSGFTTSPGECWTAVTSECPSDGDASSSLADVLLADGARAVLLEPESGGGDFAQGSHAPAHIAGSAEPSAVGPLLGGERGRSNRSYRLGADEVAGGTWLPLWISDSAESTTTRLRADNSSPPCAPSRASNGGTATPRTFVTTADPDGARATPGTPRCLDDLVSDGPRDAAVGDAVTVPVAGVDRPKNPQPNEVA